MNEDDIKKLGCVLLGGLVGAALVHSHNDDARKSAAEKANPEWAEELADIVWDLLNAWKPPCYKRENSYTKNLYDYLGGELEPDISLEMRTGTSHGIPDILIDDMLVLELKVNPKQNERNRLIGQCCHYSVQWMTWAIVIDMPKHRVRELEEVLKAKDLHYIEVIPFD